jgi:hypothetical protein
MLIKIFLTLIITFSSSLFAIATGPGKYYVTTSSLKIRLGPNIKAVHHYNVYKDKKLKVYEVKDNWARISRYRTTYVNNEFIKVAKWVYAKYLMKIQRKEISYLEKLISKSDNYMQHKETFLSISKRLYKEKTCQLSDFRKMRGWIRLRGTEKYFTYCGGYGRSSKIYINMITGKATK